MVIVIKKNHSLILLWISGPFTRINLLFFIASKCVKIIFKAFIGTCIPFQTSVTSMWYSPKWNMDCNEWFYSNIFVGAKLCMMMLIWWFICQTNKLMYCSINSILNYCINQQTNSNTCHGQIHGSSGIKLNNICLPVS